VTGDEGGTHDLAEKYDDAFYAELEPGVRTSAEIVVPIIVDRLHPTSVLDVGCGRGTWLRVFGDAGVRDLFGVDGPHISPSDLEIAAERFRGHDLGEPLDLGRRFDLATSLEVGEHLDERAAPTLVASLVAHAPAVLFSAAVPAQGGAGHVNERWPSYWAQLFAAHGYRAIDLVRPLVWNDDRVAFWYAQNTLLYLDASRPDPAGLTSVDSPMDLVHPRLYLRERRSSKPAPPSLQRLLRELPGATRRALGRRVSRSGETRA
jgi:SAM-dependent methyltransferase